MRKDKQGNIIFDMIPSWGQPYTLEFRKQTGELEDSNSYIVMKFFPENRREKVGSLNEKNFYPETKSFTIFTAQEMEAITLVMQTIKK